MISPKEILTSATPAEDKPSGRAFTIGTFDGVHRGHIAVVRTLVDEASRRNLIPVALTFTRHPLDVIAPERAPKMLMTPEQKRQALFNLLEPHGGEVEIYDFNRDMMEVTARDWMLYLRDRHEMRLLVVGYDNTFGSDGRGMGIEDYVRLGESLGIDVVEAPAIRDCSSSLARKSLEKGDIPTAERILGYPLRMEGNVMQGDRIGRTIGFPTANLNPEAAAELPSLPYGVYLTETTLENGERYPSITNLGIRPTIQGDDSLRIETHLLNFHGDLYGSRISVRFIRRLRPEKKFSSLEALRAGIAADKAQALEAFGQTPSDR